MKIITRKFITIFFFSFLLSQALAQGVDIRGVVSDSSTGEKLPFANVILMGTNKGVATNINGFYLLPNIEPGTHEIAVSSVGYDRKIRKVTVRRGETMTVNFVLASKPVEFSEVIVTEKSKREITEINTSVHVMDERDIRLVPVIVQQDIFRSIKILPGIVSTSDVNSQFYVRGGAGDQNLILLDGMKIYNPYHAFGIFSIFDSDIIKTTEVYTGAFPPGFGGRLSSVINMTTRDGSAKSISGRANINFLSTKLQVEGPLTSGVTWMASGRKSIFSQTFKSFLQKDLPLSFYDGLVKLTIQGFEPGKYGFQGFFSGDDLISSNPDEPDYSWRNQAVGFTAGGLIQDRVYVTAVGFENSFVAVRDPKQSRTATKAESKVREVGVRANATLYTDSHDLYFFGFEFSFPTAEYTLVNSFGVPRRLYSSFVENYAWVRYQTTMGKLQLDGGFHVDVASLFFRAPTLSSFQPRLNASYVLFNGWKGKISYGRFNQNLITVNNEDDVIPIFDAWIQVPSELDAEQADHYVIGLEGNILPTLSASVQSYYKSYGSLVSYNRDKVDALDPDYINSSGSSYGLETLLRFGVPTIDLYLAYTLGWTSIDAKGFVYPPRYDRRHNLNVLAVFHPTSSIDVTFRWEIGSGVPFTQTIGYYDRLLLTDFYKGPILGETGKPYSILGEKNSARLPAYHRLDASLTYRFISSPLSGQFGLSIVNVYNHKNVFYFDRQTGQQINMLSFFPTATLSLEY